MGANRKQRYFLGLITSEYLLSAALKERCPHDNEVLPCCASLDIDLCELGATAGW